MRYLFEDCALDTDRRELRRAGKVVALEPQVFDLLACLIVNRGRVVSKDDLLATVWEGRIVSESAMSTRINAARSARGEAAFVLGRQDAYIGVLVDDLVTRGCLEPYRMFTSRAEHRLLLRIDNADLRLTPRGREIGLIDDEQWELFERRRSRYERNLRVLEETYVQGHTSQRMSAAQLLRQPQVRLAELLAGGHLKLDIDPELPEHDLTTVETTIKYAGYLDQQLKAIEKLKKAEGRTIPGGFNYIGISGLSREMQEKLTQIRPQTLGQASRIPGVTPAALSLLNVYLEVQNKRRATANGEPAARE